MQRSFQKSWHLEDLKQNLATIKLTWVGRATDIDGYGVVVKPFKPNEQTWGSGLTHNLSTFSPLVLELSTEHIDEAGDVYLLVHTPKPKNGSATNPAVHTDYVGAEIQTKSSRLVVSDFESAEKLQSLIDIFANTLKTELASNSTTEVKTLTAGVMEKTYTFGVTNYKTLIIQNLNQYAPIEFILDGDFSLPNQHVTPDPNTFTNVQRLEAGQAMKVRYSPTKISYRSLAL